MLLSYDERREFSKSRNQIRGLLSMDNSFFPHYFLLFILQSPAMTPNEDHENQFKIRHMVSLFLISFIQDEFGNKIYFLKENSMFERVKFPPLLRDNFSSDGLVVVYSRGVKMITHKILHQKTKNCTTRFLRRNLNVI